MWKSLLNLGRIARRDKLRPFVPLSSHCGREFHANFVHIKLAKSLSYLAKLSQTLCFHWLDRKSKITP